MYCECVYLRMITLAGQNNDEGRQTDNRGVPKREEETCGACFSLLPQSRSRHIVDNGNMVCIESVPQPQSIGETRCTQQERIFMEENEGQ
ncbi:hypothetical protein AA0229_0409 [Gluconobacter cerinus NRIC 0229]|nr:hypothetical protein AA0229_0409 [Gluconobacter cerinus NRIC 0229]